MVGRPGTGRRTPTADHAAVEAADEEDVHRARAGRRSCRNDKDVVIDIEQFLLIHGSIKLYSNYNIMK